MPVRNKRRKAGGVGLKERSFEGWVPIGGLPGGTVTGLAASPAFAHDRTFFAATMAGLFRWQEGETRWQRVGENLPGPFLTALALSPDFGHDGVILVASLEGGLFRSADGGRTWTPGDFRGRWVNFSALEISPNFLRDGACFAGTMADGVFRSGDRGATWEACNFRLLDLNVLDLAISPAFGRDETIFAATTTEVFRSQNAGRAWREVAFPLEAAPVQCLAISPDFDADSILFAGTEAAGVLRSTDRGKTWQPMGGALAGACVNALALSPGFASDRTVLATTESSVCVSRDAGESWSPCAELPGALCLALASNFPAGGPALAGLSQLGVYRSAGNLADWHMANEGLSGRLLNGLVLSPDFAADRRLFVFGLGEGVIRSTDGGAIWTETSTGLPSQQVNDLVLARGQNGDERLYAALPEGVWVSRRQGEDWERVSELPAKTLALSPAFAWDATLLVGTKDQGLWLTRDEGQSWQAVNVPWREQEVLALALSPAFPRDGRAFVVVGQPSFGSHFGALSVRSGGDGLVVWEGGIEGPWEPVIHHRGVARGAVLAIPHTYPQDGRWYAALGDQFYGPRLGAVEVRSGKRRPAFVGRALDRERPTVIDLVVLPASQPDYLLAATERGVYVSAEGGADWHPLIQGLAARPIVAIAPSPDYGRDRSIYALELGGSLWHLRQPMEIGG